MCDFEAVKAFRDHALNPEHPHARGSHENGDIFFQHREACNSRYNDLPAIVEDYMHQVNTKLGTDYELFNYYGAPDADRVIVAMGSLCDVAEEVIDYLNANGEKVGLVKVRLYRPFVSEKFVAALPATVKKIAAREGAPVPPVRLREVRGRAACDREEDRCHGPHQGAGLRGRAPVPRRAHRPA